MDFNKLIARVKGILLTPKTEWPVIAGESTTVADLYKGYIVWLAAIPPIFNVKIVVGDLTLEGKMMNPVGGNQSIVGTYTKGAEKGPFQIKHL